MPLRCLLVDDESLARKRLRQMLAEEQDIEILGECANGVEAVQAIEDLKPDLVFLDIQMPEMDGFGVVDAVGVERMPATLFVTAYDQHALKAFEVHALDYLLKPYDRERFHQALERARVWIGKEEAAPDPRLDGLMNQVNRDRPICDRMLVKSGSRYVFVKSTTIQWIEAEDNYVRLHVEGTSHLVRQTMSGILAKLDPKRFRRVHRSAIVNLDYVQELEPWSSGDFLLTMKDQTQLTLSRTYRDQLGEWL